MLLKEQGLIDEIKFVHPKDMQDGKVEITANDITTKLPWVPGCHLAFDHYHSETVCSGETTPENHVIDPDAPSASRVVYDYYGGKDAFNAVDVNLMAAADKGDAAQFCRDEVLNPKGWDLLKFLMDSRTGLGRFREFRVSNYDLMMELIDYCREHTIDQILDLPDVKERMELYTGHVAMFKDQLDRCGTVHGNMVVLDLRDEEAIYAGNRFVIYAVYPQCNISIHVLWGLKQKNTVYAIGKSILDRSSKSNVGEMCLAHGGGGHTVAGTCQIENDQAADVPKELIAKINADG